MGKISGTTILVFGGSSGIGYGIAERALQEGANVIITSSSESKISSAVEKLRALAGSTATVKGVASDLSTETVEDELEKIFATVGPVNHVIYCAADSLAVTTLEDTSLPFILKAGHMRFVVPLLLAKAVKKYLPKTEKSSLTITTGSVSQRPYPGWTVIGSYAAAHHGMLRQLALDLAPVRVNLVSPAAVNTGLWGSGETKDAVLKSFAEKTLLGRVAEVDDVAEAYMYLLHNDYTTGSCIDVNGGHLLM